MNAICPYCWLTIISKLVSHHQSYATFISNFLVVIINVDSNHHWWCWYIPGRNFRSNCRNYRRALLLFEMDVANPPSPVQIEAIVFSRSKAKNCFYLYEPLENMQKHMVFWVLLIKYDNFSGKLTRIVHFCAKMWKKHAFSTCVELMTQCLTTNEYDPSLNCAVCSIARQVEHDQCFPFWAKTNETQTRQCFAVWMFL